MCVLRLLNNPHVVRLETARPYQGEKFYLRSILSIRPGENFEDLRNFQGVLYPSDRKSVV